jgi:nucleoside-diphosphate-sugar epimerase
MSKKVLVTGGAGFVGRHFVARLLQRGDEVHCVDNVAPYTGGIMPEQWPLFSPLSFKKFHFYHEDCRAFFSRIKDNDFDYSFHLAAMVGGRLMIENNPLAVADDLSIDSHYWQWAAETRPGKTICFSSSAAYPIKFQRKDDYIPLREDMIQFDSDIGMPDMSYGWAKLTHEYLAKLAFEKNGLKSVVYRPFSGYGEDQDNSYPFPAISRRVIQNAGAAELKVWGSGLQMRDFIHIEDCVTAVLHTMDRIDNADALNLGTGIFTSFIDYARLAAEIVGYNPTVTGTSDKPEGVFARGADTTKLHQHGFKHTVSFEEGIRRMIAHIQNHG